MKLRALTLFSLALALAFLATASACSSMQVPDNPTTQALGEASVVTGVAASTIAAVAPAPWGQIIAAALGALSVIGGIMAHSTVAKNNAQQMASAVTTGLQTAAQSLTTPSAAAPAAK